MVDHLHVCLSFPPKYSISEVTGFLKGKSAIRVHREFRQRNTGKNFWVRGYYVSTVGYDEQQAGLFFLLAPSLGLFYTLLIEKEILIKTRRSEKRTSFSGKSRPVS